MDAKVAIDAHGKSSIKGIFKVQNILFDQNYTAIQLTGNYLDPASGTFRTFINGCDFKCSSDVITKDAHYGQMPLHHIKMDNVSGLADNSLFPIGNYHPTSSNYQNTFSGALKGIDAYNSRFAVFYSDFSMPAAVVPSSATYGIYAVAQGGGEMKVSINPTNAVNTFTNLSYAIFTDDVPLVTIESTTIDNCINGITTNKAMTLEINDNTVTDYDIGIGLYNSIGTDAIFPGTMNHVLRNNLNVGITLSHLTRFGNTGIDNQNAIGPNIPITISTNTIYNSRNGIYSINTYDSRIGIDATDYNTIIDESLPGDAVSHYGIWMVNSQSAKVHNNIVQWTGGTVDDPAYLSTHIGIGLNASTKCTLKENTITNYGAGFNIFDDCRNSDLLCNEMIGCYHGVYLDPNSPTSLLSTQGNYTGVPANDKTWDNKWTSNVGSTKVDGATWGNQLIRWVYDSSLPSTSDWSPAPSAIFVLTAPGDLHNGCYIPQMLNEQERNALFGDAVGDSTDTDGDSLEFVLTDKETFYKQVKKEPSILDLNVASDYDYATAFAALQTTNIGKYEQVKEDISVNDKTTALQNLIAITDANAIDANKKYVASLIAMEFNPASDADSDTVAVLTNIAYLHPFYGGQAVYWARGILRLKIEDELPTLRRSHEQKENSELFSEGIHGKLFPIPANESATFAYEHKENVRVIITILDALGTSLMSYTFEGNEINFPVSNLAPGIYYVRVYEDSAVKEEHKLSIIR
jgi:hypothetical protein